MARTFLDFLDQTQKVFPSREPGQPPNDDSKERERRFTERAAAVERLKQARLDIRPVIVEKECSRTSKTRT
jgi:hypothetical protein